MAHRFSPLPGFGWCRTVQVAGALPLLAVLLVLGGCASVPPPDAAMNQAQAGLQAARQAGAADYDPVDLGFAQDKFQQAQTAMSNRKFGPAADLAAESSADSSLARTKAMLGAARAQIQLKLQANTRQRAQNEQAKAENAQHEAQQRAQLAQQQAATQVGPDGQPASASSTAAPANPASTGLPAQAPMQQDMPAPSAATLASPTQQGGNGFQTVPDAGQPAGNPASSSSTNTGGQP
ncbi:MAG: DUF4398 domain-containing protein [Rhodanobacter sp.]|nr:MAG: DUF4398 domain-containing protein [Rhodanobacter sp.]